MDNMLNMSEEDIKLKFITPQIMAKGWSFDDISMEAKVKLTDGKMNLQGNLVVRSKPKYADYMLYYNKATPIAVVEAKDAKHTISYGLQQAKAYAEMMKIPFAYSSNGQGFQEYDFLTGQERSLSMDEFPTKEELYQRFIQESHSGKGLSEDELKVIEQPYCTGQDIFPPRYYQRNAVNLTVNAVAQGEKRLLLVMATGTGKTYTAFQIVYRLLKAGLVKKVLYLADRNVLVDQSIQQDFKPLNKTIHKVNYQQDQGSGITAYEVYFALYQQLIGQGGKKQYEELFKPEFFDMVIVDECHRGSAKDDSNWREILDYFSGAVQLGMTATPKETAYQSSISYFGEPLYTYSLKEGIEDGFLAPFKVVNITTNIGDEWRPTKGQVDINGNEIPDRIYNNTDYDYNIILQDRHREVAEQITKFLKHTDRMAKTIVFCADEQHAEYMRTALVNANADMCKKNPDYVVRITGSDNYGQSKLDYFISVSSPYPVIATTSKLLSTGVDCKMVKLIVLDQRLSSMTEFKQIVGRGTRIREKDGKTHFTIMDFRNVTRLFADPDWDGPIEVDDNYPPKDTPTPPQPCGTCGQSPCVCPCDICGQNPCICPPKPKVEKSIVNRDGCQVRVLQSIVSVYDTNGKLLRTESITDYTKRNINETYANLDDFIQRWNEAKKKEEITKPLEESGIDLKALKQEQGLSDVDDFDFICHIAYGKKPLTRRERAEQVKKRDIFNKYGNEARKVLEALLEKYTVGGIRQLEDPVILQLDPFRQMGTPAHIAKLFGGKAQYYSAVRELETFIYSIA
ncbi:type I restriction-modification system, restriction subunit R [Porphyromonas crevioricanis JCM 15906]|uniref:Type I restriction-modification system, restriction subunit R n=1 Tax=Porphyromonas crevioricanis JCM 15906 TaxID=1305617 RepID=T1CPC1_9PORP|nr:DEAD/DEAH box helicase family protein [Porphyromonas crevioricanis]GAD04968.1 type I restriction-modification system, restriction subunit R [Porphyromonas crevioricanis JCM 15906]SKA05550.1 type I restriction enzyme, R subunit [Porphyromonas crevioricanis]